MSVIETVEKLFESKETSPARRRAIDALRNAADALWEVVREEADSTISDERLERVEALARLGRACTDGAAYVDLER